MVADALQAVSRRKQYIFTTLCLLDWGMVPSWTIFGECLYDSLFRTTTLYVGCLQMWRPGKKVFS